MLTKVCNKCGVEKTIDCFNKSARGKYGTRPECKSCAARQRIDNKEHIVEQKKEYYKKNKERILATQSMYKSNNKDVISFKKQEYYRQNKEENLNKSKITYQRNRDAILVRHKKYQQKRQQEQPHKINAVTAKRRAAKLKATPSWVDNEAVNGMYKLAMMFNRTGLDMHVDHIVPLNSDKVCGLHCEANLQLLLASDNISKGNRWWPDMW